MSFQKGTLIRGCFHFKNLLDNLSNNIFPLKEAFDSIITQFQDEYNLVLKLSTKQKSNYYCWSFITWCLDYFSEKSNFDKHFIDNFIVSFEKIIYLNISDYCIFNFRLNLYSFYFKKFNKTSSIEILFANEFKLIDDLVLRYVAYQTVWYYRRYIFLVFEKYWKPLSNSTLNAINDSLLSNSKLILNESFDVSSLQQELMQLNVENFEYFVQRDFLLCKYLLSYLLALRLTTKRSSDTKAEYYVLRHKEFLQRFMKF
jgi:hypothetical protein